MTVHTPEIRLSRAIGKVKNLRSELVETQSELAEKESELEETQSKLAEKQSKLEEMQSELAETQRSLAAEQRKTSNLQVDLDVANAEKAAALAEVKKLAGKKQKAAEKPKNASPAARLCKQTPLVEVTPQWSNTLRSACVESAARAAQRQQAAKAPVYFGGSGTLTAMRFTTRLRKRAAETKARGSNEESSRI